MSEAWVSFFWGAVIIAGIAILSFAGLKGCESDNARMKACFEYHSPLECSAARMR